LEDYALSEFKRTTYSCTRMSSTVDLYKNEFHSGFNAFGIEFKSMNKFQMYYYFVKTFKRAIDSYVQHPVFE